MLYSNWEMILHIDDKITFLFLEKIIYLYRFYLIEIIIKNEKMRWSILKMNRIHKLFHNYSFCFIISCLHWLCKAEKLKPTFFLSHPTIYNLFCLFELYFDVTNNIKISILETGTKVCIRNIFYQQLIHNMVPRPLFFPPVIL